MLTIRKARERGHANHGWLDTHHTFSFADYFDERFMGFGPLRVINDDTISAGSGFPPHAHRDMEIITYVLEGAIEHKDSMGNGSIIKPGEVQRMSAGSGVTHSEYNASKEAPAHFLQIWIVPSGVGLPKGYEQKLFAEEERRGKLRLVASPEGRDGSVKIQQDARIFATTLEKGETVRHAFGGHRKGWLHVARGSVTLNDTDLEAGDGAAIEGEDQISISSKNRGEALLFDLAG